MHFFYAIDCRPKAPRKKRAKIFSRFFFDHVGAKRKASFAPRNGKKKAPKKEFRRLRTATRIPHPRPRRLLKKAGENFHHFGEIRLFSPRQAHKNNFLCKFFVFVALFCKFFAKPLAKSPNV